MHGKFSAAKWKEYCTANTVRIRIDILYQWTCRFAFFLLFRLLFYKTSLLFLFFTNLKSSLECLCTLLFLLHYIHQGFLPLIGKFLILLTQIQSQNTQFFTLSLCTCSLQYVLLLLYIIFKFSLRSWQVLGAAQWVEHCTANAVRVRMETCRFDFFY